MNPQASTDQSRMAVQYAAQARDFLESAHAQAHLVTRLDLLGHAHWCMLQSAAEYNLIAQQIIAFEADPDPARIADLRARATLANVQAEQIHAEIKELAL